MIDSINNIFRKFLIFIIPPFILLEYNNEYWQFQRIFIYFFIILLKSKLNSKRPINGMAINICDNRSGGVKIAERVNQIPS